MENDHPTQFWLKAIYDAISNIGKIIKKEEPLTIADIKALSGTQLDALKPGDTVIKQTGNQKHAYSVKYKDEVAGEIALVYVDFHAVEEVYYEKSGGAWGYVSTEIFPFTQADSNENQG